MQPITLYSHPLGPNPWKVAIILSSLGIPYETVFVDFKDVKNPPFIDLNPNGRLPAIIDPNKDIQLWESGAIIIYLIETYDVARDLSYDSFPERFLTHQWLHFQTSGQGPYYGQLGWFTRQTTNQPVAIERYTNEVRRVTGVLDRALSGRQWLVGDKCTFADLAFVPWQDMLCLIMGGKHDEEAFASEFPNVHGWMERMKQRPEVKRVLQEKENAMSMMGNP
ncbi:Glutathione S-transferase protein-domain protein [Aspergillus sclerotialis]|uniref:glutathione transferase n=1 Tax=Aspergillus sclerotialis TaxID=2070753 RepID=A0A3A2ZGN0_9EURO|nr:Glutathione S-transferase protein-domain protein [Aspergillus sclerotialis]